jgi:superfamily I DNA/RNA helicase
VNNQRHHSYPLSVQQREIVEGEPGPLVINAGPGAGKTGTVAARVRWLLGHFRPAHGHPPRILVLSSVGASVAALRARLPRTDHVRIGTVHAFCRRLLAEHADALGLPEGLRPVGDDEAVVLAEQAFGPAYAGSKLTSEQKYGLLLQERERTLGPDLAAPRIWRDPARFGAELVRFDALLRAHRHVDFGGLLFWTIGGLQGRKPLLFRAQELHDVIVVDEAQDLTVAQYAVIRLLAERHRHLLLVGDVCQCIYQFSGARPDLMLSMATHFPEARGRVLDQNFRSDGSLVDLGNSLSRELPYGQRMWTGNADGAEPLFHTCASALEEGQRIADYVASWLRAGIPPTEIGILARRKREVASLRRVLEERRIPLEAADGGGPGVAVATIHRAKGREWDYVCGVGVEEGLLPSTALRPGAHDVTDPTVREEWHCGYVLATRARRVFVGSHVPGRWVGGTGEISRFVASRTGRLKLPQARWGPFDRCDPATATAATRARRSVPAAALVAAALTLRELPDLPDLPVPPPVWTPSAPHPLEALLFPDPTGAGGGDTGGAVGGSVPAAPPAILPATGVFAREIAALFRESAYPLQPGGKGREDGYAHDDAAD